jgi:hypothetical protein
VAQTRKVKTPDPFTRPALDKVLDRYSALYWTATLTGSISKNDWVLLGEEVIGYMNAAGFDDSAKSVVFAIFERERLELP